MAVPPSPAEILAARAALDLTQEELAGKLGVSQEAISKWETGNSTPSQRNAVKIWQLIDKIKKCDRTCQADKTSSVMRYELLNNQSDVPSGYYRAADSSIRCNDCNKLYDSLGVID